MRSLGADHVLDYRKVDYTKTGERYDWILDTDSHHSIRAVRRALRPNGSYVTLGGTAWPIVQGMVVGPLVSLFSDRWSGLMLWWKPFDRDDLATITDLIAAGKIKPVIDRRFPLERDRRGAPLGRRWARSGQGRDHRGRGAITTKDQTSAAPATAVERLAHQLSGRDPGDPLSQELVEWLAGSARFRAFAEAHRDKIRKKVRGAADPDSLRDVRAELRTARLLLADRRIELAFEAYGSGKTGPDFTITFRGARSFNLEVTRLRRLPDATGLGASLLAKLRQLPPSAPNAVLVRDRRRERGGAGRRRGDPDAARSRRRQGRDVLLGPRVRRHARVLRAVPAAERGVRLCGRRRRRCPRDHVGQQIGADRDAGASRPRIPSMPPSRSRGSAPPTLGAMKKPPVTLAIDADRIAVVEGLLLKAKAGELSELRRVQTQLSVYGDRRSGMEGEPAAIATRLEILSDLLRQIEEQRSPAP